MIGFARAASARAVARLFIASLAIGALATVSPAYAQHLFEPEIGIKFFDGKINEIIGPGVEFGGTYGRVISNSAAVTLHADFGFHDTQIHGDYSGNPGGSSFDVALGVMFSPALRNPTRSIAPYAGAIVGNATAGIGGGGMSWTYGLEAGLRLGGVESRGISLGVRLVRLSSSDEFVLAGRWLFRLPV